MLLFGQIGGNKKANKTSPPPKNNNNKNHTHLKTNNPKRQNGTYIIVHFSSVSTQLGCNVYANTLGSNQAMLIPRLVLPDRPSCADPEGDRGSGPPEKSQKYRFS